MNKLILLTFLASLMLISNAKAGLVYTTTKPSALTPSEAIKAAKNGVIYKCAPAILGPNASPVKAPGAENVFTSDKLEHSDAALESIIDGKTALKCQSMVWSDAKMKLVNSK